MKNPKNGTKFDGQNPAILGTGFRFSFKNKNATSNHGVLPYQPYQLVGFPPSILPSSTGKWYQEIDGAGSKKSVGQLSYNWISESIASGINLSW